MNSQSIKVSSDAKVFLGYYFSPNDKHRTPTEYGPDFKWQHTLELNVPPGHKDLHVEVVNESAQQPQLIGQGVVDISALRSEDASVTIHATDGSSRPLGQAFIRVLSAHHPPAYPPPPINTSHMASPPPPYESHPPSHPSGYPAEKQGHAPDRQGSYASLGPGVVLPSGYGAGQPPPFRPPAGQPPAFQPPAGPPPGPSSTMPFPGNYAPPSAGGHDDKGKGADWKKYGGMAAGAAAAVGMAAFAVHEYKEHEEKKHEQEYQQQHQPAYGQHGYPQHGGYSEHQQPHYDNHHDKHYNKHHDKHHDKHHNKHERRHHKRRGSGSSSSSSN
ncbi:hypothetical protein DM01DRAFT_313989 [Hesseltinella vesiculosa]|uniref:C2 domain-containing protein n=1 Tax=Hesseltinella vesiculosa TaxID=101127 RepID=A0A1X2GRS7_9FUNG|nr:hypothetical protein DM01DRAFT_313989 [Hesseltinella vesiculosa]